MGWPTVPLIRCQDVAHGSVAGLAIAGFLDGDATAFRLVGTLLAREREFSLDSRAYIGPRAEDRLRH